MPIGTNLLSAYSKAEVLYDQFMKFCETELPKIESVNFINLQTEKVDARVCHFDGIINLEIDRKYLDARNNNYYEIILYHEFTHILDMKKYIEKPQYYHTFTEFNAMKVQS